MKKSFRKITQILYKNMEHFRTRLPSVTHDCTVHEPFQIHQRRLKQISRYNRIFTAPPAHKNTGYYSVNYFSGFHLSIQPQRFFFADKNSVFHIYGNMVTSTNITGHDRHTPFRGSCGGCGISQESRTQSKMQKLT